MIKNVALKKFLSGTVFQGISALNRAVPVRDDVILLYCNMEFRDNIRYLYDYLIEQGYNKKYTIIRSQNEPFAGPVPDNVKIVSNAEAIGWFLRAGHVFYTFGKLPIEPAAGQKVVQTWHGAPFKGFDAAMGDESRIYYTAALSSSEFWKPIVARLQGCGEDRVAICGQPRTDVMYEPDPGYKIGIDCDRLVMWMPTFRKSALLGYSDVEDQKTLVPLFSNQELSDLNEQLRADRTGLLIKLHPSQDLTGYQGMNLSNIRLMSHEEFGRSGWDLYRLMGITDALITDYSSVFTDYMLLDRPIAFTLDDYEDYKATRGFSVDDPDALMAGHKIRNREDFLTFMADLAAGRDPWASERRRVNRMLNQYQDGQNRRRCLEIGGVTLPADEKKPGADLASGENRGKKSGEKVVKTGRRQKSGTTVTGMRQERKEKMTEKKGREKNMRLMTPEEQKQVAYEILCWLKDLCDKEGIHYSLSGGTLLGAVRHKGFIPWDDDVDVFLLRPEFDRLDQILRKQKDYKWITPRNYLGRYWNYGRLINTKTKIYDEELGDSMGIGIFIDICYVDGLPDNPLERRRHIARMRSLYRLKRSTTPQKKEYVPKNPVKRVSKSLIQKYTLDRGVKYWNRKIDRVISKYPVEKGQYVCNLVSQYGAKEILHRSGFDHYIEMPFEDRTFSVFAGYEEYLRGVYGDYMQLPPEDERVGHHFDRAYWIS